MSRPSGGSYTPDIGHLDLAISDLWRRVSGQIKSPIKLQALVAIIIMFA